MYTEWTKHLHTAEEKTQFERTVMGSKEVLERLTALLDEKMRGQEEAELSPTTFDNPNWAYRQAYRNGYKKCLVALKQLIDLDNQKVPTENK